MIEPKIELEIGNIVMYKEFFSKNSVILITRVRNTGFDGSLLENGAFTSQKYSFMNKYIIEKLAESELKFKTKCPEYLIWQKKNQIIN